MKSRKVVEDSALQAGWIFADLFLALTVIFLATVSFIPSQTGPNSNSSAQVKSSFSKRNIDSKIVLISNGFIGEYRSESTSQFVKDFNNYLKGKGAPTDIKAVYIEAVGNTPDYNVSNEQGNIEAIKFIINIRKALAVNLSGVATSVNLSPDVPPGYVRIKITFV